MFFIFRLLGLDVLIRKIGEGVAQMIFKFMSSSNPYTSVHWQSGNKYIVFFIIMLQKCQETYYIDFKTNSKIHGNSFSHRVLLFKFLSPFPPQNNLPIYKKQKYSCVLSGPQLRSQIIYSELKIQISYIQQPGLNQ